MPFQRSENEHVLQGLDMDGARRILEQVFWQKRIIRSQRIFLIEFYIAK